VQGQLGISKKISSFADFREVPELHGLDISKLVVDNSQNVCLANNGQTVLYWGWPLCTRTTYRFLEHYEKVPRLVRFLQRYSPFFRGGIDSPMIEATFQHKIEDLQMGCGYLFARDESHNCYAWGDNYSGQLGTGDDIHRDDPTLIKSLSGHDVV